VLALVLALVLELVLELVLALVFQNYKMQQLEHLLKQDLRKATKYLELSLKE
jgi:hypothetical protein